MKQHFENLLGNPHMNQSGELLVNYDIKLGQFTQEELNSVLRKI